MSRPSCHVGDKYPVVCQSDDQFFLWDYAISHGLSVSLNRFTFPRGNDGVVTISVPDLGVLGLLPFDLALHEVVMALRG